MHVAVPPPMACCACIEQSFATCSRNTCSRKRRQRPAEQSALISGSGECCEALQVPSAASQLPGAYEVAPALHRAAAAAV